MPLAPSSAADCPFCRIAAACPLASPPVLCAGGDSVSAADPPLAYTLLSTPHIIAFLDHAPISRGHVLVATRQHRVKLGDTSIEEGMAGGAWRGRVSRAVVRVGAGGDAPTHAGSDNGLGDWNVVQNNGARAAQVVPHVHFHIIPRTSDVPEVRARSWTIFGRGQREELDEEDAALLRAQIQDALWQELDALREREGQQVVDMLLGNTGTPSKPRL